MDEATYKVLTDKITAGLLSGDYGTYRQAFHLPVVIAPRNAKQQRFETDERFQEDFELYHASIKLHHVDMVDRQVRQIENDGDRSLVRYRTLILNGANLIVEPFESAMHFEQRDGRWGIVRIDSSLGHINWSRGEGAITENRRFVEDDDSGTTKT